MTVNELVKDYLPGSKTKLWTADFVLICLSSLSVFIAFHSLLPTLPIYIESQGGSRGTAGLALAFLTIAAVIIRPFTGWALDNYGRKIILTLGLLTFLIPSLIYTAMVGIIPLLIFRLIQGFGWGMCNTAQGTVASDIIPHHRLAEGLGYYSLTISISLAAAPAIGLWLVDTFSFRHLFITSSILTLASLLLALKVKYPKPLAPAAKTKLVFIEKRALRPSVIILLMSLSYSSIVSFLALFVRQKGMSTTGLFFMFLAITSLLSRPPAGKIVDRKGRRGYDLVVLTGLISIVFAMLVLARLASSWHLILGGILFGIGFGFLQPTMQALSISSVPPERRGAANATYWTAFDTGVAVGSVFWGVMANFYGYPTMFNLTIIPPLIALLIYFMKRKLPD